MINIHATYSRIKNIGMKIINYKIRPNSKLYIVDKRYIVTQVIQVIQVLVN